MLVEETARDTKILNAITAVEKNQIEEIFYPFRPHRHHLTTRFGLLFYNDKIVIPEAMRSTIIAMLHQGHPSATKMDQSSAAFWWPGLYREIKEKVENCPSCRSSGKNLTTQLPSTEKNYLEILSEPNQEIQIDFAGRIKSKTRGDVYILVALDRFSKWPTAKICKNTDTRTVLKFLTEYCSDNGTPRSVRTDNGSCFKSNEFKEFCNQENIKRIRCTPNLHTGTGQVERTIRTIKSLTRANMADGLTFEEGVKLTIKTIRQTPHSKLNMTPFQMHYGRKPRTAITNLIGRSECLLSNWKKTLTNYVSAQPTELQMFTINDSEGEMADYLILNDSKKRNRSVSKEFKQYQFFEKENKPNAMKCRFKTNKILTAVNETKHTITTSDGKIIHKKLASKPIKFQLPKKPEEKKKPTNRCVRCGKFSQGKYCDTHKRIYGTTDEPGCSYTLPTLPERRSTYGDVIETSNGQDVSTEEQGPQASNTTVTAETQRHEEETAPEIHTPPPSTPVQFSTSYGAQPKQPEGEQQTPIRATANTEVTSKKRKTSPKRGNLKIVDKKDLKNHKIQTESPDLRRSSRIKGAKRTVKLGEVEYF